VISEAIHLCNRPLLDKNHRQGGNAPKMDCRVAFGSTP